ncbi:hypothetical protein TNCV_4855441 [Trichonephila clavipes]|nr:hypothetical protein TNCV_4855441 [Trichonephila clavipes]
MRAVACFEFYTSRYKSPERILRIDLTCPTLLDIVFSMRKGEIFINVSFVFIIKYRNESANSGIRCSKEEELLLGSMSDIFCSSQYASAHHGAQQGEEAIRSSDMRQAWHLPQRWHWGILLLVRDMVHQFTQVTPNCNNNPKATLFGILRKSN